MRITDHIAAIVEDLIGSVALGEPLTYDVIPTMRPGAAGPTPVWAVMIVGRSITLNEAIAAPFILIEKPHITEDEMRPHVAAAVEKIKAAKQSAASRPATPTPRPPKVTPAGLILS